MKGVISGSLHRSMGVLSIFGTVVALEGIRMTKICGTDCLFVLL